MCRAASLSNVHTPPQKFVNLSKWFLWTYMDIYSITYFCRLSFYDNIEGTTLRGEKKGNFQWKSQEAVLFWSLVGGQFSASRQEPNKRTTWESLTETPLYTLQIKAKDAHVFFHKLLQDTKKTSRAWSSLNVFEWKCNMKSRNFEVKVRVFSV